MKAPPLQPIPEEKIQLASEGLRAIAHRVRLSVLCQLVREPMCVGDLLKVTGTSQPNLSQHLARMRMMGILEQEKRGQQVFYRISGDGFTDLLRALQKIYCPETG